MTKVIPLVIASKLFLCDSINIVCTECSCKQALKPLNRTMPRKLKLSQWRKNSQRRCAAVRRSQLKCVVSLPYVAQLHVLRNQIQSYGELPHGDINAETILHLMHAACCIGWVLSTTSLSSESIQLCQLQHVPGAAPTVHYGLVINRDYSWSIFLCGKEV